MYLKIHMRESPGKFMERLAESFIVRVQPFKLNIGLDSLSIDQSDETLSSVHQHFAAAIL